MVFLKQVSHTCCRFCSSPYRSYWNLYINVIDFICHALCNIPEDDQRYMS